MSGTEGAWDVAPAGEGWRASPMILATVRLSHPCSECMQALVSEVKERGEVLRRGTILAVIKELQCSACG